MKKLLNKKVFAVLIIIIIGVFYFTMSGGENPVVVEEVRVFNQRVERSVSASGEVKSKSDVALSFPLIGVINKIEVIEGDYVEKNTLIASLDTYEAYNNLQSTKDARDIAIRDRDLYVENYETNQSAVGGFDEYAIALRRQNELVSKAEATYEAARASFAENYLYAPVSGTIVDVSYEVGETIGIGASVVRIADLENLVFEINVDQEDYGFSLIIKFFEKFNYFITCFRI